MSLDRLTLQILSALGEEPLGSVRSLSKAVGISEPSLKAKLESLYGQEVLLGVSAQVNPASVGLEPIAVFAEMEPDQFETFERICELHPYTRYRIRCFGSTNGTFSIFSLPMNTTYLLLDLLEKLKGRDLIKSYNLEIPTSPLVTVENNFAFYDEKAGWKFDWDEWEKSIPEVEPIDFSSRANVLKRLDEGDMRILRQLSKDARRKKNEISKEAGVEPYHLSRRRKFLEEEDVIQGYRVLVGEHLLQLTSHAILRCRSSIETTRQMATALSRLPFQSTLIPTLEGFILYTTTTSLDFPSLVTILRRQCTSIESMWCDYRSSFRYWFYDKPFEEGSWKADAAFMVDSVLENLDGSTSDDAE